MKRADPMARAEEIVARVRREIKVWQEDPTIRILNGEGISRSTGLEVWRIEAILELNLKPDELSLWREACSAKTANAKPSGSQTSAGRRSRRSRPVQQAPSAIPTTMPAPPSTATAPKSHTRTLEVILAERDAERQEREAVKCQGGRLIEPNTRPKAASAPSKLRAGELSPIEIERMVRGVLASCWERRVLANLPVPSRWEEYLFGDLAERFDENNEY